MNVRGITLAITGQRPSLPNMSNEATMLNTSQRHQFTLSFAKPSSAIISQDEYMKDEMSKKCKNGE
jgi:hypothetical protein